MKKNVRISKQAAVEYWKAYFPKLLGYGKQREMIVDLLEWLNSATGCDAEDPLGFFLTDAYDKRLKEREKVKSVLSCNVGKSVRDGSSFDTTDKLDSPLLIDDVLPLLNALIRERGVEGLAERKCDCSRLDASDDDTKSFVVFKGPVFFIGNISR